MKKNYSITSLFFICLFSLSSSFLFVQEVISSSSQEWQHIFEKVKKGVVQIECHHGEFSWGRPDLPPKITKASTASGFFIEQEGKIFLLTNNHVVDSALYIEVRHPSFSEKFQAKVERVDLALDAALLSLEESAIETLFSSGKCEPLSLADSAALKIGDSIVVVGYPLGFSEAKIVEGLLSGYEVCDGFSSQKRFANTTLSLQVSCATNPENSGGPCLDKKGKVIGIVSCGIEKEGDRIISGINFCIPITSLYDLWNPHIFSNVLKCAGPGAFFQLTNQAMRTHLGFEGKGGIYVTEVLKGGFAEKAGLKVNDLIYSINNLALNEEAYLFHPEYQQNVTSQSYYCSLPHGSLCTLQVVREGEKIELSSFVDRTTNALLTDVVDPFLEPEKIEYEIMGGAVCIPFFPNVWGANPFNATLVVDGFTTKPQLIIINTLSNSPATSAHVACGGIVSEVNNQKVETIQDLRKALSASSPTGKVTLKMEEKEFYVLSLEEIKNSERRLAPLHNYKTTSFMKELLENYQK